MSVHIERSNFQTECNPEIIGPFEYVQITYNNVVRVEDDRVIAAFTGDFWKFDDGTEWTDITVIDDEVALRNAVASAMKVFQEKKHAVSE